MKLLLVAELIGVLALGLIGIIIISNTKFWKKIKDRVEEEF